MISIIKSISDFSLKDELWSGALDTINEIIEKDKLHELINLLEEMYPEPVDITTINDLLWFEDDYLFEQLNMTDNTQSVRHL